MILTFNKEKYFNSDDEFIISLHIKDDSMSYKTNFIFNQKIIKDYIIKPFLDEQSALQIKQSNSCHMIMFNSNGMVIIHSDNLDVELHTKTCFNLTEEEKIEFQNSFKEIFKYEAKLEAKLESSDESSDESDDEKDDEKNMNDTTDANDCGCGCTCGSHLTERMRI